MTLLEVDIKESGYPSKQRVISNVKFTVEPGKILGMIGSNGAGKSTTIKTILGELPLMEGKIVGLDRHAYSYIPERPIFYQELTLWEHFEFVAAVEELTDRELTYAKELLQEFHLINRIHDFPDKFSKGMQQKAMIALALFKEPDLLIIDEPFMGLDPGSTRLFLQMIEKSRTNGTGILMCTHILDLAERICDDFIIVEKGTVKALGTLEEVLSQCGATDNSLYSCISTEEGSNIV